MRAITKIVGLVMGAYKNFMKTHDSIRIEEVMKVVYKTQIFFVIMTIVIGVQALLFLTIGNLLTPFLFLKLRQSNVGIGLYLKNMKSFCLHTFRRQEFPDAMNWEHGGVIDNHNQFRRPNEEQQFNQNQQPRKTNPKEHYAHTEFVDIDRGFANPQHSQQQQQYQHNQNEYNPNQGFQDQHNQQQDFPMGNMGFEGGEEIPVEEINQNINSTFENFGMNDIDLTNLDLSGSFPGIDDAMKDLEDLSK